MKTNINPKATSFTHEGAPAKHISPLLDLRRAVSSCLLWENQFYESGEDIATRLKTLVTQNKAKDVATVAIEAREKFNLRHAPLFLMRELARTKQEDKLLSETLARVIQRADELAEFIAIYWKDGKRPLPKQVKRGLAWALHKFNEYELAKYDREGMVKLRDVIRLVHPKPRSDEQAALWKRAVKGELATPDTWEVSLSAGKDKKETFTRLLQEGQLGYLALIRNLRKMTEVGVDGKLIANAILARKGAKRVLPFRYIAAARAAVQYEPYLDSAMQAAMKDMPKLPGTTLVLVDHSGSMTAKLSGKSDMDRSQAAAAVAILATGLSEHCRVFAFSEQAREVPPRAGMGLADTIKQSMPMSGTYLGAAVRHMNTLPADRLIVITDEQSHDKVPDPVFKQAYLINVASYKNGVGYGKWTHIDGFSESVIRFIREREGISDPDDPS